MFFRAIWLIACFVTRTDYHIMEKCRVLEKMAIVGEALLLLLVGAIAAVAWATFWNQFLPLPVSLALGVLATMFILLLDQAVGACDWRLAGVLKNPAERLTKEYWARVGIRCLITMVLSFATATGAEMAMFHQAIQVELDKLRREENQRIEDQYGVLLDKMIARKFGNELAEIKDQKAAVASLTPLMDAARERVAAANAKIVQARIDQDKELHGKYRPGGAGPKFHEDEDREAAAKAELAQATTDLNSYTPRLNDATEKLAKANEALKAAEGTIQKDIDDLEVEKQKHLQPAREDPLLNYMALQKVYESPEGPAARSFGLMMRSVLIIIELSYLAVRMLFNPASVYMVRLRAQTLVDAKEIDSDYDRRSRKIEGTKVPRPPLRIVHGDDD